MTRHPVASLYTPMSNLLLDAMVRRQRGRFGTEMIPRGDSVRRALREGKPVMLAADMDFGLRDSVFVPFFGVPACTLTSVSRMGRAGNARVVPFVTEVLPDYRGYKLTIFDPLSDFPSDDVSVDARRILAPLRTASIPGGWSTFAMALRYAHLAPDQLAQHAGAVMLQEPARLIAVK
ncbi:Lipid A biosynthesis lauroyltransferase [Paraburkholderia ultramafica]|uniref:Lipid A biosynthesis lauroyltransferase n=1 Tax=Paraburkholderia ultramafica TaxID=1544867 RepID=A0A6S7CKL0_9BURK|nr:Lipid A biosynthesis lauroyltransferase [Paraburkholderia ultramafica]